MHLAEIVLQWEGECAQPILGRHHGSQEVNAVSRSDYLTRPRGLGHGHFRSWLDLDALRLVGRVAQILD